MKSLIKGSNQPKLASFHVKKGDEVVVIAGTQRGQRGKILEVQRNKNRVLIEGVNLVKKAARPTQENPQGGITEREGSIHVSNVVLATRYDTRKGTTPPAAPATVEPPKKGKK
jgi:large subunit ribosomal protein L24